MASGKCSFVVLANFVELLFSFCFSSHGCKRRGHTSDDLAPLLRQSFLQEASFKAKFDGRVFDVLIPFRHVFHTATVNLPTDFEVGCCKR